MEYATLSSLFSVHNFATPTMTTVQVSVSLPYAGGPPVSTSSDPEWYRHGDNTFKEK